MNKEMIESSVKEEILQGLKLIQFKNLDLDFVTMNLLERTLENEHWIAVSDINENGWESDYSRLYYNPVSDVYINASAQGYYGTGKITRIEEEEALESLSFDEIKSLGKQLNKKSVSYIRIYANKEREYAEARGELEQLASKTNALLEETEAALRKTNHP